MHCKSKKLVKGTRNEHEIWNFQENHREMMKRIYCTIRSRLLGLPLSHKFVQVFLKSPQKNYLLFMTLQPYLIAPIVHTFCIYEKISSFVLLIFLKNFQIMLLKNSSKNLIFLHLWLADVVISFVPFFAYRRYVRRPRKS